MFRLFIVTRRDDVSTTLFFILLLLIRFPLFRIKKSQPFERIMQIIDEDVIFRIFWGTRAWHKGRCPERLVCVCVIELKGVVTPIQVEKNGFPLGLSEYPPLPRPPQEDAQNGPVFIVASLYSIAACSVTKIGSRRTKIEPISWAVW